MKRLLLVVMLLAGMSTSLNAGELEEYRKVCNEGDVKALLESWTFI